MKRRNCWSRRFLSRLFAMLLIVCAPYQVFSEPICKLEDVSPGPGSTAGWSLWGKMLSISTTGLEGAIGPATSWSTSNAGVIVDHVAAADKDGHLVLFYSYPGSDWKAVNVMEKTNATIAIVRPESWVFPDGQTILERLAAPSPSGDLLLFTWHAGSDWTVANLTTTTQKKITGPVTSWQTPLGNRMVEHIGARGIDNHFLVFWRIAGGDWAAVDVTTLTGQEVGDSGVSWTQNLGFEWAESVAMPDPTGNLILFTYQPSTNWQTKNLGQLTGQKVAGAAAYWSAIEGPRVEYLAAPAPNGDLVLFYTDPIESSWKVFNITNITGKRVIGPVTNWNVPKGGAWWENLGGRGDNDHLYVFFRPAGGIWQVKDVTDATSKTIIQYPTSWITPKGSYYSESLASPSWDGHLHIFTFETATNWTTVDPSLSAYGRIVYAASEMAGIWQSRDYGMNWTQLTRPQPDAGSETAAGLDVHLVLDVVASPTDPNLVLAATNSDNRNPSRTGIYRSRDGGNTWALVHKFKCGDVVQPATQIVFAPGDPKTLYAVGGCGIAIGTKSGEQWTDISSGISSGDRVWHIAVSEELPGEVRRGYACGDGKVWYTLNIGKEKWHPDNGNLPVGICGMTGYGSGVPAANVLAVEPGNSDHVYLAVQNHASGRCYFYPKNAGPDDGVYCHIPVVYDTNGNGVYDKEDLVIWPTGFKPPDSAKLKADTKLMYVDANSNGTLDLDESVVYDVNGDGMYGLWDAQADSADPNNWEIVLRGTPPKKDTKLAYDANVKYAADPGWDKGEVLAPRGTGYGSLWYGDFSSFDPAHPNTLKAIWSQLPGPPVMFGRATGSGRVYVATHRTKSGYLLFFSNCESTAVSMGKPTESGWHGLDGLDPSSSKRSNKNQLLVHVDPHAVAASPDFDLALKPVLDLPFPYNQNMELDRPVPSTTANLPAKRTCYGRIWTANDGGIYRSDDCGQNWIPAQAGLSTLASHNIAGVAQVSKVPGEPNKPPALYFGTGDNDDFFSLDGGKTWRDAKGGCGDCDVWYADSAQPNRLWRHPPRDSGNKACVVFASPSGAPNPEDQSQWIVVDYPDPPSGSSASGIDNYTTYFRGSRPVVQTLAGEAPLAKGDYMAIQEISPPTPAPKRRVLIRAKDSIDKGVTSPWVQAGPDLPSSVLIAQASGGHAATVFYVGDENNLWRWPRSDGGKLEEWQQIVPGGSATRATRFFANPYDSNDIYILDPTTVRHSTDGGITWPADEKLDSALTAGGTFQRGCDGTVCAMNDMVFDRNSSKTRFALGLAGVFYSGDGGGKWSRLVDTRALPSRPRGAFFDPITDPKDPSLYIAFEGRGIMRCHPIPLE